MTPNPQSSDHTKHQSMTGTSDMSQPSPQQSFQRSTAMGSGKKSLGGVLVVDDEPDVRRVVRITLQKAGYHVLEAEDGEDAKRVLSSGENPLLVDTIITDIRMPKVNGVEAISFFQKEYPSIPLIVLTAHPDLDMATGFMSHGIVDYLVKPVEGEKLKSTVARAVENRQINFM